MVKCGMYVSAIFNIAAAYRFGNECSMELFQELFCSKVEFVVPFLAETFNEWFFQEFVKRQR